MSKALTVGELRKALEGVPDEFEVRLGSDSGIDQGLGEIVIESAHHIKGEDGWFEIYANDHCDNMPDCEPLSDEENKMIMDLLAEADSLLGGD